MKEQSFQCDECSSKFEIKYNELQVVKYIVCPICGSPNSTVLEHQYGQGRFGRQDRSVNCIGMCGECFEPIQVGYEVRARIGGKPFHRRCIEKYPNSYLYGLEQIWGRYEGGEDPTVLLDYLNKEYRSAPLEEIEELQRVLQNSK